MERLHFISIKTLFIFCVLMVFSIGCHQKTDSSSSTNEQDHITTTSHQAQAPNTLTAQEKQAEWKVLFDGNSTKYWRLVYGKTFPQKGWKVHDGVLTVLASNGRQGGTAGTGSIVTKDTYADFELQLDFKITKGANSGIKYFVVENPDFFESDPTGRGIGLEYQVLDDKNHPDANKGVNGNRTVASLYDMIPADTSKKVNPMGEWNHVRLISNGPHVEHWLNGDKVLEYERGSDAFRALVDNSKYDYKNFGQAPEGHILLQDHGTRVSFKDIKIRRL